MKLDNVFKKTRIAVGRKNYITFTRRPEVPEGLLANVTSVEEQLLQRM